MLHVLEWFGSHLMYVLGLDDPGSPFYLFWSGFGSDIAKATVIYALIHQARAHRRVMKEHHRALQDAIRDKEGKEWREK